MAKINSCRQIRTRKEFIFILDSENQETIWKGEFRYQIYPSDPFRSLLSGNFWFVASRVSSKERQENRNTTQAD